MKNTVIDINIFMDFLFKRQGHESVVEVFKFCMNRNADYIITRNIKDFKKSIIPAKTPEELILLINDDSGNDG